MKKVFLAILVVMLGVGSMSADWSSCSSALQDLSSSAQSAESDAQAVEQAEEEYEDQKDRYDRCRQFPDTYDLYSDGCATLGRRAKTAKSEFDSAVDQLTSSLSDVESGYEDVQSNCSRTSGAGFGGMCTAIRSLRGKYTDTELLTACKTQMTEALCKVCLGVK